MKIFEYKDDLMNLQYLTKTEKDTILNTNENCNDENTIFINLINIFFRLHYYSHESYELNSDDHLYNNLLEQTYLRLPYNLRSINILWSTGFYLESIIILRQILESFVTLRYFDINRDKIRLHFNPRIRKGHITFRTMFDKFVPGFYEVYYGPLFSNIAHGGISAFRFRTRFKSPSNGEIQYGCKFDQNNSNFITIPTFTLCYGFINYIDHFFPNLMDKIDKDTLNSNVELKKYLEDNYLSLKENRFIQDIKPLISKQNETT